MSRLELFAAWLDAPEPSEAFGPERATWARLQINLEGEPLTMHHAADYPSPDRPSVIGGMSGLAEWIVDSWLPIHLEIHTPFPKLSSFRRAQQGGRFPSARDAVRGWPDFVAEDETISGDDLGAWQQRHTLGEARSDIALPSIVFVPEGAWMGIGLDHVPAALSPTVRFSPPTLAATWPAPPVWVPVEDVSVALQRFVDATIERAASDAATAQWAQWLLSRWSDARARAKAPDEMRRWMFGNLVAQRWTDLERRLDGGLTALSGVLVDSRPVTEDATLDSLAFEIGTEPAEGKRLKRDFVRVDWGLPPFREGYRLAQEVRSRLKLGSNSLDTADLTKALARFGVQTKALRAHGLFRSAVWTRGGGAMLGWANDDPRFHGEVPSRFAIAAGFGRFLSGFAEGEPGGAAHGEQARWRPTQLANAFAAELLLPVQAISKGFKSVEDLAKSYGISRSAAEWHIVNRSAALEG